MSSSPPGSECLGNIIDETFPLIEQLGSSAHSSVFLTELAGSPPQKAALKIIPTDEPEADALLARLQAAQALAHPHLVHIFHAGRCLLQGRHCVFLVTELADERLSEILPERPLTPEEARQLLDPLLDALSFLHIRHFIHGAITPSNVFVVNDQLKLSADAIHREGEPAARTAFPFVYQAPELAVRPAAPAADTWSLGVLLVEALTQQPPVWDPMQSADPVVPSSLPAPFRRIAQNCLRVDPARRSTIGDIYSGLNPASAAEEEAPAAAPTAGAAAPALPRRVLLAGALLVVAAVVVLIRVFSHSAPAPQPPDQSRSTEPHSAHKPTAHKPAPDTAATSSGTPQSAPQSASAPAEAQPSPAPQQPAANSAAGGSFIPGSVAHEALPDAPQKAVNTIHGHFRVSIRVEADASGNVTAADFSARGPSRYFANLALEAAHSFTFHPPQRNGASVPSQWLLHYEFARSSVEVTATPVSP